MIESVSGRDAYTVVYKVTFELAASFCVISDCGLVQNGKKEAARADRIQPDTNQFAPGTRVAVLGGPDEERYACCNVKAISLM